MQDIELINNTTEGAIENYHVEMGVEVYISDPVEIAFSNKVNNTEISESIAANEPATENSYGLVSLIFSAASAFSAWLKAHDPLKFPEVESKNRNDNVQDRRDRAYYERERSRAESTYDESCAESSANQGDALARDATVGAGGQIGGMAGARAGAAAGGAAGARLGGAAGPYGRVIGGVVGAAAGAAMGAMGGGSAYDSASKSSGSKSKSSGGNTGNSGSKSGGGSKGGSSGGGSKGASSGGRSGGGSGGRSGGRGGGKKK